MNKFSEKGISVQGDGNSKKEKQDDFFPPKEDRINLKEVAELFGATPQTVINWKKKNLIPFYQINQFSRPFYSRSQLIKLASKNQHLIKH